MWLHDISYEKAPTAAGGVLRYKVSSILRDKDSAPGFGSSHEVFILRMNKITGE